MTIEKALIDVAICKLNRNPSKKNVRVFLESNEDIFQRFRVSRPSIEKLLTEYFSKVSYPKTDPNLQVGRLSDIDLKVIELISHRDVVMVNKISEDSKKRAVAVKFIFGDKHPTIILPISEEYNLDQHADMEGISTKDIKKWYYIKTDQIIREPERGFKGYPTADVRVSRWGN